MSGSHPNCWGNAPLRGISEGASAVAGLKKNRQFEAEFARSGARMNSFVSAARDLLHSTFHDSGCSRTVQVALLVSETEPRERSALQASATATLERAIEGADVDGVD